MRVKTIANMRRPSADRHADLHQQSGHAGRRLSHAGDPCRCDGRVHPHQPGAALSRQRPPGGGLCDRAAGRSRRRRDRHRSGRAAPAQLIPPEAMPFKTGLTFTYDCGEFEKNMDMALSSPTSRGSPRAARSRASAASCAGFGISYSIERAGTLGFEGAEVRFDRSGAVTLFSGSVTQGQGHETVFKQLVCDRLGIHPRPGRSTCRATPTRCSSARAPAARARRRSPDRHSTARSRRSPPRRRRLPPICSASTSPTSTSRTASSPARRPTGR